MSDEDFDEAIDEAKAEGNLSRANIVRKTAKKKKAEPVTDDRWQRIQRLAGQGASSGQLADEYDVNVQSFRRSAARRGITFPADQIIGRHRRIDSNRVVGQIVLGVYGEMQGLNLIDFDALDPARLNEWATSLSDSLRLLNRLNKQLKEMTQ